MCLLSSKEGLAEAAMVVVVGALELALMIEGGWNLDDDDECGSMFEDSKG